MCSDVLRLSLGYHIKKTKKSENFYRLSTFKIFIDFHDSRVSTIDFQKFYRLSTFTRAYRWKKQEKPRGPGGFGVIFWCCRMSDVIFTHFRGVVAVWLVEKTVSEGPFYWQSHHERCIGSTACVLGVVRVFVPPRRKTPLQGCKGAKTKTAPAARQKHKKTAPNLGRLYLKVNAFD